MKKLIRWILKLRKKKWECYEIWRPNIPDNGCTKQCKECKEKQNL